MIASDGIGADCPLLSSPLSTVLQCVLSSQGILVTGCGLEAKGPVGSILPPFLFNSSLKYLMVRDRPSLTATYVRTYTVKAGKSSQVKSKIYSDVRQLITAVNHPGHYITVGFHPISLPATVISGFLCFGSSLVLGRYLIVLLDPVNSMIKLAKSCEGWSKERLSVCLCVRVCACEEKKCACVCACVGEKESAEENVGGEEMCVCVSMRDERKRA